MTLTEQWKKGELPRGWYYVKGEKMYEGITIHWIDYPIHATEKRCIQEVLAPVPSYEEWKSTGKFAMEAMKVAKENQQLKELLLSSRGFVDKERITLETSGFGHNEYCRRTKELLTAIDNTIGEKK